MSIVHLRITALSRASGANAVETAARYAAVSLEDRRQRVCYDYTHESGVMYREIFGPRNAVPWWVDRSLLWNIAEATELRRDSRVGREYEIALPHELTASGRLELVRRWAQYIADRYRSAVDLTVHAPPAGGDSRNHYAKLLSTVREVTATGLGRRTVIELRGGAGPREMRILHAQWKILLGEALGARQFA
jgi:hypothetical protein